MALMKQAECISGPCAQVGHPMSSCVDYRETEEDEHACELDEPDCNSGECQTYASASNPATLQKYSADAQDACEKAIADIQHEINECCFVIVDPDNVCNVCEEAVEAIQFIEGYVSFAMIA